MTMTYREILRRIQFRLQGRVVHLRPKNTPKGRVLISYTTLPFLDTRERTLNAHSNRWECKQMAQEFLDRGYAVDVIDFDNTRFVPKHAYDFCIDPHENLERLDPFLNAACIRVYHATNAHWLALNSAEYSRLKDLQQRRGVTLLPQRSIKPGHGVDFANIISTVCGTYANETYTYTGKQMFQIPVSSTHTFDAPADKNFDQARNQFIWFGGAGAVHKGLDLVLEAFAAMPQYRLLVCGKFGEPDFQAAYHTELYETPNIKSVGYIDPQSDEFEKIRKESLGIVYPSSSEGCATSVVVAMHAGFIPIVSPETGVETKEFGITLSQNTVEEIQKQVRLLAAEPRERLQERAKAAQHYASTHHTRAQFAEKYRTFVDTLETERQK